MSVQKAFLILCACATVAQANAKSARTAIDKLEAEYAPIGKVDGAARVTAACADAAKLYALSKTIPDATPPTGSVVDAESWGSAKHGTGSRLDDLVEVCKAPDHKLTIINKTETADQVVASVDERVRQLIDLGKSRTLPPAVAMLRTTFAATRFPSKAFCSQIAKLTKQAGNLATPDKADATKWTAAVGTVKGTLSNLKCKMPADADEQIGSSFDNLREELAALLLVIPPS